MKLGEEEVLFVEKVLLFATISSYSTLFSFTMGPSKCAVVNCYNNKCKLDKWRQSECNLHPGTRKGLCPCPEPFRLFCFHGPKLYKDRRDRWIKLMRRTTVGHAMWIPKPSDRVCSNHFVDKEPTPDHPDPTIHLGYDFVPNQHRR